MATVQYRKLWETEQKVRYAVATVPDEKSGVEFDKANNTLAPSEEKARGLADALLGAIIRRQLKHDPTMTEISEWPQSGEYRL
jgi:hypothetical protein